LTKGIFDLIGGFMTRK